MEVFELLNSESDIVNIESLCTFVCISKMVRYCFLGNIEEHKMHIRWKRHKTFSSGSYLLFVKEAMPGKMNSILSWESMEKYFLVFVEANPQVQDPNNKLLNFKHSFQSCLRLNYFPLEMLSANFSFVWKGTMLFCFFGYIWPFRNFILYMFSIKQCIFLE